MDVTFIIVNYNTTALTLNCVHSIYQFTKGTSFEVIIIDNASSDRSILDIATHFPNITLLSNEKNIGFGQANNQGIMQAKGKYLFLLNSDTLLTSDATQTFFSFMEDEKNQNIACCGGELMNANGDPRISYGNFPSFLEAISSIGFLVFYKRFYNRHLSSGVFNYSGQTRPVDYICGADMFIRKSILQVTGAFDPDFFLYFEEVELARRIKNANYHSMIIPEVKIIHYEGASQDDDMLNIHRIRQFAKSRRLYFNKCYGKLSAMFINKIYALQAISFFCTKQKKEYLTSAGVLFRS